MVRSDPLEAARSFVEERYVDAVAAFLAGGVASSERSESSDLDIVVLTPERVVGHEVFEHRGWLVECMTHTEASLEARFRVEVERRRPTILRIISEGIALTDRSAAGDLVADRARSLMASGPAALTADEIDDWRFAISTLVDDLAGPVTDLPYVVGTLAEKIAQFVLVSSGQWSGSGKWAGRLLRRTNPTLADALTAAMLPAMSGDIAGLQTIAVDVLAGFGGPLQAGYVRQLAPRT